MREPILLLRKLGGVRWITLNRPNEANALSLALAEELRDAIADAEADPDCLVLILAGNGRFFCSGGDVIGMADAADQPTFIRELAGTMHDALLRLALSRLITIAAVDGPAAGGGLGLVLNADLVFVSRRASFIGAYSSVGLTPDCGVSYLLPRAIGPVRAASILLTGEPVGAEKAFDWGLVTEVVDEQELYSRVEQVAANLTTGAAHILGPTKRLLSSERISGYGAHLQSELDSISAFVSHPDSQALIRAFSAHSKGQN